MATKLSTVKSEGRKIPSHHLTIQQENVSSRSEHNTSLPDSAASIQTPVPVPAARRVDHPAADTVTNPAMGEAANYKDYSRVPLDAGEEEWAPNNSTLGKGDSFPAKLHLMLSAQDHEEFITWMPHGRSWRVVKPKAFEEKVIPLYFEHAKFASFMRQVNGWGFKRIVHGPDHKSYYHELFLRGSPQLSDQMQRPPKVKRGASSITSKPSASDSNLTLLSSIAPLPSAGGAPIVPQWHPQFALIRQHHKISPPSQHCQVPHTYVTSTSASAEGSGEEESGSGSGEGGRYSSGNNGNADYGGDGDDGGGPSNGEDKVAASLVRKEKTFVSNTNLKLSIGVTSSTASSEYAGGSEGGEDSSSDSGSSSSEDGGSRQKQQKELSSMSPNRDINQNSHVYPAMGGGPIQAMQPTSVAPGSVPCVEVQQAQGGKQAQQQLQMVRVVNQHGHELGYVQLPSNQGGFPNQMPQNSATMKGRNPQYIQGQMMQGQMMQGIPQATMQQQQQCMIHNRAMQQPQLIQQPQVMQQPQRLVNQTMQQQQQQRALQQQQMMQQAQQQQHRQAAWQQVFHPQTFSAPGPG